jgi:hypothetical protein
MHCIAYILNFSDVLLNKMQLRYVYCTPRTAQNIYALQNTTYKANVSGGFILANFMSGLQASSAYCHGSIITHGIEQKCRAFWGISNCQIMKYRPVILRTVAYVKRIRAKTCESCISYFRGSSYLHRRLFNKELMILILETLQGVFKIFER